MAIRQKTINTPSVAGGDAVLEEYLDKKGVTWVFHPRVEPSEFDAAKSLGNQARIAKPIDEARVEQYAEAMRRGEIFPPVIAHGKPGKYVIADGNHRLHGALRAKKPLRMYLISADARTIVLITFEANTRHGLPTSEDERIQQALYLIDNGANIPEAAAALSLSRKVVDRASQQRNAEQRFMTNNIPLMIIEKLGKPIKNRLKDISTDEGFVAAVNLTNDAALVWNEVAELVTETNALRSSSKQVEYVASLRENLYRDRIQDSGGGTFTRKSSRGPKGRVNMSVGNLLSMEWDDLDSIASGYLGPEREEAAEKLTTAAQRLTDLAKVLTS